MAKQNLCYSCNSINFIVRGVMNISGKALIDRKSIAQNKPLINSFLFKRNLITVISNKKSVLTHKSINICLN